MGRQLRIAALWSSQAFAHRSVSFVWFLISLWNPLIYLVYWKGATLKPVAGSWDLPEIVGYYVLLIVAGTLLMAHMEETVAEEDIARGGLSSFLLKPYPYLWARFFSALPWRLMQGSFGVLSLAFVLLFFGVSLHLDTSAQGILLTALSAILAYFLSFFFKMCLGLTAFWLTETSGLRQTFDVLGILFGGFVMPVSLFPEAVSRIIYATPFPYMVYVPISILMGSYRHGGVWQVIAAQSAWLLLFMLLYAQMWKRGLRKFSGVGL